ncbi:MAG: DNA repair protein RadA [Alphaproteobacteria bacterium]|nr:DNA repair protein RadA [Alphaproteobacteria bacterium]
MAKFSNPYVCQACGAISAKWAGRCDACGEWNSIVEEVQSTAPKGLKPGKSKGLQISTLADAVAPHARETTGIAELDRVLGGGLVEGSAILLGGDPGIGKSTLLLQAAAALASGRSMTRTASPDASTATGGTPKLASVKNVLYISGEESLAQIQLRSQRLGLADAPLKLATATSVRDILASIDGTHAPDIVIIDSIQTMFVDSLDSAPGTVAQVRASTHELIRAAKKRGFALILVGHVTKDGQIAGPRVLEHMVDTVLYFEGDRGQYYRILRAVKNRFGATDEIGVFAMSDTGLEEVKNPSALFLHAREHPVSGAAVFAGMEGTRPLLIEIQALVSPSSMSTPRRATVGYDSARLSMILAVLETRAGMRFADKEVFLNVAGGLKITEPAADVAVAMALLSALLDKPLPVNLVGFGEIGLTGEIRSVSRADTRLKEAVALGFTRAVIPSSAPEKLNARDRVAHVDALVRFMIESG